MFSNIGVKLEVLEAQQLLLFPHTGHAAYCTPEYWFVYCVCVVTYVSCIKHVGLNVPKHVGVNTRVSVYMNAVIGRVLAACSCIHSQLGEKTNGILCVCFCIYSQLGEKLNHILMSMCLYTSTVGGETEWCTNVKCCIHSQLGEKLNGKHVC